MVRAIAILLGVILIGGCGGGGSSDDSLSSREWRQDIDFLAARSRSIHPDLFHSISRNHYDDAVADLKDDVSSLSFAQIVARIHELVALAAQSEDGHSQVTMFQSTGFRLYPLRLHEFADGVLVIDALPAYQFAIGQRVVQIGGMDMAQVNARLDPLIPRDNSQDVKRKRTLYYVVPEILHAVNVIGSISAAEYTLDDGLGNLTPVDVSPIDKEVYRNNLDQTVGLPQRASPLTLSNLVTPFWMQLLPTDNALYVKYNWVFANDGSGTTIAQFSNAIAASVAANNPQKVIIDMRHNRGGDNTTPGPLLNVLSSAAINQAGKLYVIIGRDTFSAAANFVAQLDLGTNARFVGEPTGGSLNNYGDAIAINLPNSNLEIFIPTIYWVYSPGDPRITVTPDIAAEWTSSDYFNQLDPVLQAALDD